MLAARGATGASMGHRVNPTMVNYNRNKKHLKQYENRIRLLLLLTQHIFNVRRSSLLFSFARVQLLLKIIVRWLNLNLTSH